MLMEISQVSMILVRDTFSRKDAVNLTLPFVMLVKIRSYIIFS